MSLVRLTRLFVNRGWHVDLVLNINKGDLEHKLDPRVNIKHLRTISFHNRVNTSSRLVEKLITVSSYLIYFFSLLQQFFNEMSYIFKKYDVAVIGLHGLSPRFCCKVVRANKCLHWIRNDLAKCDSDEKARRNIIKYSDYTDAYICVAKQCKDSFDNIFPNLESRSHLVYNVIDVDDMERKLSKSFNPYPDVTLPVVLSVCRLDNKSKAIFRMLNVHKRLTELGYDFHWYVLGDGPDKNKMFEKIGEYNLSDRFHLVGRVSNPFPFYKYATFVAIVSYYEGLCGVTNEAKVSGKAVVSTLVSGVTEQLINNKSGMIVDNDEEAIIGGIKELLDNKIKRRILEGNPLASAILNDNAKYDKLLSIISDGE
ncbi:glycosyltransferase [Vibrio sp. 10N.286.49.B1]|uniref:glycosyltransferase n=1 Tax=unclassified Vibrio TaxID=2614977 RepID=UPI0012FFDF9B|nr:MULTISPECIES: glycosyltransferase [unclassified Vibrio]